MKASTKAGIAFIVLGFLAGVSGPLLAGDSWNGIGRVALPVYLGLCFLAVFALRLREIRARQRERRQ